MRMAPKKTMNIRKSHKEPVKPASKSANKLAKTSHHTNNGHGVNGHAQDYQGNHNGHNGHNGHSGHNGHHTNGNAITLRNQTAHALDTYFTNLNGHQPGELYNLVLREVEEPLFRAVLIYVDGNQSRAAEVLGINRGTLRKKLREYGLHDA